MAAPLPALGILWPLPDVVARLEANIGKCINFMSIEDRRMGVSQPKNIGKIVSVDRRLGRARVEKIDPNRWHFQSNRVTVYSKMVEGEPFECPPEFLNNNVQMVAGKRRSRKQRRTRKQKRTKKGKSRKH